MRFAIALFVCVLAAQATGIDGRWTAQPTVVSKKASGKQAPTYTLDLKSQDGKLTGTVTIDAGKKVRPQAIENGKVDGDRVTFTTHTRNKKSEATFQWAATLNGDRLTGTRSKDGVKRGQRFIARRAM